MRRIRTAAFCALLLVLSMPAFAGERGAAADSLVGSWSAPEGGNEDVRVRATGDSTVVIGIPGGFAAQCFLDGTRLIGVARFQAPRTLGRAAWPRFLVLQATWATPTTLKVSWVSPADGKWVADETWYFVGRAPSEPNVDPETLPKFGDYVYVEELPEAITKVNPSYPDEARRKGIDGTVMVQALVGTDGLVKDVRVVKSIPMLDEAAKACVRQWRFKPAMSHDNPVAVWVGVPLHFSLH
jgi:protein TonB